MPEAPEKNLALDIVRITEAAALSSARWLGRGNKEAGDGAAVDAMRNSFSTLHVDGIVVIGEGEKDHAPMLYNGEKVGMGDGPQLDVAVDPVEGTSLLAYGRPNAISTVAVAPRGSMFNPGPSYYMQKLVVAREARDVIDLDAPVDVNLHNVARALGKNVQDLVVFVLDKPRHKKLIEDIRSTGARIQLHTDGDVAGALMAVDPRSEVDVMMGTGGTPEGVLAACAIKGMGGQILARLDPQSYVEKEAINEAGIDIREVLTVHDLVRSDDCFFAATGISGGDFLRGVRYSARHAVTHSLVLRGKTGTLRYVESLLLLLGTLWAAAIIFWVQAEGYAQAVSGKFISLPWPLPAFWWLAPALAVFGLLPWLFVVTGVNWGRVFATSWKTLRASRKENSGSSFLWIALFFSLPLSLLGSGLAGATPALCLLAILLGRALVRMGSLGSKFFYLVIALLFLHAGMLLAALHFPVALEWLRTSTSLAIPQQYEALLTSLDALPVLGGLCIVFAVLLARFTRRAWPGGSLLVCTLFAILLAQPAHLWLAPQLAGHAELKLAAAQPLSAAALAAPAAVEESAAPAVPEAAAETAAPETPAADAAAAEAAPAPEAAAPAEAAQAPETPEDTAPATDAAAPAETQAAPAEEAAAPAPAEGTPAPAENAQPAEPVQEAPAVQTLPAGPEHGAPIPPEAVPAQ